jgi:hypothetical protein
MLGDFLALNQDSHLQSIRKSGRRLGSPQPMQIDRKGFECNARFREGYARFSYQFHFRNEPNG